MFDDSPVFRGNRFPMFYHWRWHGFYFGIQFFSHRFLSLRKFLPFARTRRHGPSVANAAVVEAPRGSTPKETSSRRVACEKKVCIYVSAEGDAGLRLGFFAQVFLGQESELSRQLVVSTLKEYPT